MPCSLAGRPPVRARRFCPGVMRQMATTGRAHHATVPDMDTRILAITAALLVGCGPLDIDITTTAAEGTDGDPNVPDDPGTTSLGASDTGAACGSTSASTSTVSSGGSTDDVGGTSTTGEGSSSGEPPVCTLYTDDVGAWHCECDGVEGDIAADCGCVLSEAGCVCGTEVYPAEACGPFCEVAPATGTCYCDGVPSDPRLCGSATCSMDGDRCECGGVLANPWLCGCVQADDGCFCTSTGEYYPDYSCGWACAPSGDDPCVCGSQSAPPDWCDCMPVGVLCVCGGATAPPEACS
jgi:hypothetical protein